MNKEELNNCFESITPTREQKDKMFAAVMKAKEQPVKVVKFNVYKYMSVAAAVIVLGVFLAVYPGINKDVMENDNTTPEIAYDYTTGNDTEVEGKGFENEKENPSETLDVYSGNADEQITPSKFQHMVKEEYPQLANAAEVDETKTAFDEAVENPTYAETPKADESKAETVKAEAPKAETPKGETPKVEAPKVEAPKEKTSKTDTTKTENTDDKTTVENVVEDEFADMGKTREIQTPMEESIEEDTVIEENIHAPQIAVNDNDSSDESVYDNDLYSPPFSAGGGSASGGGGGGSVSARKYITFSQIKGNDIYSSLIPEKLVGGFTFTNAFESNERMEAHFATSDGRYMSVSIVKNDRYVYQQIVTIDQLRNMPAEEYMEFAVKCGNYYVVYYVETDNAQEVYEMVTSSAYFK